MVRIEDDADFFNDIANHPKVKPWIVLPGQDGPLDVSPLFAMGSIGLRTDHGGFMLVPRNKTTYEPHAFFLPQEDRAARAAADGAQMLEFAFCSLNVAVLLADIPITSSLRGTGALLTATGFTMMGGDKQYDFYRLSRQRFLSLLKSGYYDIMLRHSH